MSAAKKAPRVKRYHEQHPEAAKAVNRMFDARRGKGTGWPARVVIS